MYLVIFFFLNPIDFAFLMSIHAIQFCRKTEF